MKPEYLTRKVTINQKSFTELGARLTSQRVTESDNVSFALTYVLCAGKLHGAVQAWMFEDRKDAKTFTGAEMLAALMTAAKEQTTATASKAKTDDCDTLPVHAAVSVAGVAMLFIFDIMDELFGSDADEENHNAEVSADA